MDLGRELTRRHEHEPARPAGRGPAAGEPRDQREREAQRLARAGLRPPQDVASGERVGERRLLDRERRGNAVVVEHGNQRGWYTEGREGRLAHGRVLCWHGSQKKSSPGLGVVALTQVVTLTVCPVTLTVAPRPWKPIRSPSDLLLRESTVTG